jgi:signal transduction histidine kinase
MITVTPDWLRSIDTLKEVPAEQLQWWIDHSRHYIVSEGDDAFEEDDAITATLVVVSGSFKLFYMQNGSMRELPEFGPQTIMGHLPFSRGKVAGVTARAISDAQLMEFPITLMQELIHTHFELTQALVHIMTDRVREGTAYLQQHEKMMALGKLSAGLAHELNNPAAAIVRSSTLLKQHLLQQPETFKKAISVRMDANQVDALTGRMFEVMSRSRQTVLTLMQRSDKEEELTDWLDEHEVENALEIAEHFVEFGFEPDDLEFFNDHVKMPHLSPVLNWVNNNLITEKMVTDIQEASQRISDLVGSVKNFTHMDRAQDKQFSDIRIGIRNTLTMLNHKIKKGSVTVIEQFDETLSDVKAFIGELNQVWTNIIDNALDALEGTPDSTLEIKTERDKEFVKVTIADNGPGIPKDDIDKIFDPFFTTKEIGKGTGLGLDVVLRIVKQHRGSIKVTSVPGRTAFVVCFPIAG